MDPMQPHRKVPSCRRNQRRFLSSGYMSNNTHRGKRRSKMIHLGNYNDVLQDVRADLIFTSPPYNIGSKAPRQDGFRRSGKFDPKSYGAIHDYPDDLPESIYQQQQIDFFHWAASHITINGTLVYNHKP